MAQDSLIYHAKALAMGSMVNLLSNTSLQRELSVQTDKLARMAREFDKKLTGAAIVLSMPPAKLRRERGTHLRRLAQQSKHLDEFLQKAITEFAVQHSPTIRLGGKGKRNAFCQKVVESFNGSVHKATEQLKLQTVQRLQSQLKP